MFNNYIPPSELTLLYFGIIFHYVYTSTFPNCVFLSKLNFAYILISIFHCKDPGSFTIEPVSYPWIRILYFSQLCLKFSHKFFHHSKGFFSFFQIYCFLKDDAFLNYRNIRLNDIVVLFLYNCSTKFD